MRAVVTAQIELELVVVPAHRPGSSSFSVKYIQVSRADLPVPKRMGTMSKLSNIIGLPSRSFSGSLAPASPANVAMKSSPPTMS